MIPPFHKQFAAFWLAACGCMGLLFGGCSQKSQPAKDAQLKIPVVATHSILADWIGKIGADQVAITTLVPAEGDPHTFEPTPRDGRSLNKAMLVFENGLHFESWLDELFEASGSRATRVQVSRNITPRKAFCVCHGTSEDPHVFQSVKNAQSMVRVIAEELSKCDPEHAELYSQRAADYLVQLDQLDKEIESLVVDIPKSQRLIITAHNTFGYFAEDYGFEVLSLLDSLTSEAADPSAMKMASLIRRIKEMKIPAIFSESTLNSKLIEQVAREANIPLVKNLNSDSLGALDSPAGNYIGMMRLNAQKIAESLR